MVSAVRISAHRKYPLAKDLIFGHGLTPSMAQRQGNSNSDYPFVKTETPTPDVLQYILPWRTVLAGSNSYRGHHTVVFCR